THLAAQAEHDVGLCSRRSHFEPALRFAHGLIGDLLKTQCVDIEVEGLVLVAHANADGTNFCEHVSLLSLVATSCFTPKQVRISLSGLPTRGKGQKTCRTYAQVLSMLWTERGVLPRGSSSALHSPCPCPVSGSNLLARWRDRGAARQASRGARALIG